MTTSFKSLLAFAAIFIGLGFAWFFTTYQSVDAGISDAKCTTRTVGHTTVTTASGVLVATTSESIPGASRAYAKLRLQTDAAGTATTTVYLSFDEGAAAALNRGAILSTSTPEVTFGLNTPHPYDGAVTGISSVGNTTLLLTECTY